VEINSRVVTVTGPRGKLTRSFKHLQADVTIKGKGDKTVLQVDVWFGTVKQIAVIRTVTSHIQNMITGVTKVCLLIDLFLVVLFVVVVGCCTTSTSSFECSD